MAWLSAVFLNPLMLAAVVAVTVPIIIEWLFRRRKRQIELPTIRYLLDNEEQEKIKRQDRILLLLRMAAIGLLVFAIARPLIQHGWVGGDEDRNVFVLLDGTASMNQQVDVMTAFGLAQRKSAAMIRALPEGRTAVTILHVGDRVTVPVEGEKDLHTAAAKVEALSAGAGASSMAPALDWVKSRIEELKLPAAEVYVFSDFQKHTWKREGDQTVVEALGGLEPTCETYLVDVGGAPQFNYVVTNLRPEEFVLSAGMEVRFQAAVEVRGTPPQGKERAPVTFLVDGIKKDVRSDVDLSGGSAAVTFQHRFPAAGEYLVEVTIDGDDHRVDNTRMYLCRVPEDVRVLVLDETVDASENPGTWSSRFLTAATRPVTHAGVEKLSHFLFTTISPLKYKFENLGEYGAVVLTDLSRLDQGLVDTLTAYVEGGGTLWVFSGPRMNLYDYNRQFHRDGEGLLPAYLVETANAPSAGDEKLVLQYGDSRHPAVQAAFSRQAGDPMFDVAQYVKLKIDPQDRRVREVLPFSNGDPAIVEKSFGEGKSLLFATGCGLDWNSLPTSFEFVILVQELLRYSVGNPDRGVNLDVGQTFEQPVNVSMQHLLLRRPDGSKERLTPKPRTDVPDLLRVSYDDTTQQGLYRIVDTIEEVLPRRRFVVNQQSDAGEGDLSRFTRREFADVFSSSRNWNWIGPERPIEDVAASLHTVTELAPWILWLLGGVLAVETLLAWRFGRRRGEAAEAPGAGR